MGSHNNGNLFRLHPLVHHDGCAQKSELLQKVDDTMAVLHTHAIAGSLGGILTGLFAHPRLCMLFYADYKQYVGLFYGFHMGDFRTGFRQIGLQLLGILFVVVLNVVSTSLICLFIQLIVPLRMSEEDMAIGDEAAHGEEAYAIWGQGERLESSKFSNCNDIEVPVTTGQVEMI
ncbi:unnamed protein product [Ilex paraguariensis]|uniref:Ammonium transporter AmtB-like domain-containing protein n=1 Tax=Ilex paraguariensis TaxID=185542 RepID=A0ABC8V1E0_9AQUA